VIFSIAKSKKAVLPVFIIITGLSVLFCGCDLSPPPANPIEDYDRWYLKKDNNYSDEEWQRCLVAMDALKEFGITIPERFLTLEDAEYIVKQRSNLENGSISATKPVTIAMYPVYDYGARPLSAKYNGLTQIINQPDQQVLYFQIGNDNGFKAALKYLKDNLPQDVNKLVLILTGHGNVQWLRWYAGDSSSFTFDPSDYNDEALTSLLHSLPIKLAIFHSCAAGEGGAGNENQANRLAGHIRSSGKVIAPVSTVMSIICSFDSGNNIDDVRYDDGTSTAAVPYYVNGTYAP